MAGESLEAKLYSLGEMVRTYAPLVIAYSGGVDSAFLLAYASETISRNCLGVIADSPSLPRQALADALSLAAKIKAQVEVISTAEMNNPGYTTNPLNRCYYCKAELFAQLDQLARARGFRAIAYGENADDARQVRPGRAAAAEFQVLAPLKEVGLTKSEIRAASRVRNLPTADAPAQPCLSSRIPHGTPVTREALAMIERAETIVRELGFRVFRVRHHVVDNSPRARVEILPAEMGNLCSLGIALEESLGRIGYTAVTIDPNGYRTAA